MDVTSVSERQPELEKVCRHVRILIELGRAAGNTADFLLVACRFRMAGGCRAHQGGGSNSLFKTTDTTLERSTSWQQTSPAKDICRA